MSIRSRLCYVIGLIIVGALWPAACRSAEDVLVDAFSDPAHWKLLPDRIPASQLGQSKLETVAQPIRPGVAVALKLSYDLERCHAVNLKWLGGSLLGRPTSVFFWLFGDGQKHHLTVRLEDAAGQSFLVPLGNIDWTDWRKIEVPMEESKWEPMRLTADEPCKARWPMALREVRVERRNVKTPVGSLIFSELRTVGPVEPLDRLQIQVTTDVPANVFYQPDPAVLLATLENPTETPLEGQLETVAEDWLGNYETFDHGPLALSPKAAATRTLQIPLKLLGAYRAWVRFRIGDHFREMPQRFAINREISQPVAADPDSPFGALLCEMRIRGDEARTKTPLMIKLGREAGVHWTVLEASLPSFALAEGRLAWNWPKLVAGKNGRAIEFWQGRSLTAADSPSLSRPYKTGEMTIACLLRFDRLDNPGQWLTVVGEGDGAQRPYHLFWHPSTHRLLIAFGNGKGQFTDVACTKTDWKTGQWYHLVVAHRRNDHSTRWWVDGQLSGEGTTSFDGLSEAADMPLAIGGGLDFSLDDLAIYDNDLAPDALAQAKPVAHWTFDELKDNRFPDVSGNGNNIVVEPCRIDQSIEQMQHAGINAFGLLMNCPSWMEDAQQAGRPLGRIPRLDAWSTVIEATTQHFAQRGVHTWQVWNEPNNAADYYPILAASYTAIKKVDPKATVLGCAVAGPSPPGGEGALAIIEDILKRGGANVMDAIAIHPYQPSTPENPEFGEIIRKASDLTARYGRRLPIWFTEIGWSTGMGSWTEAAAAKMLVRSYLLAIAAGVERVFWYDFRNDGVDPFYHECNFGLLRNDYTPKPSYFAFRTMSTELAGMKFVREVMVRDGISLLVFGNATRNTAVAWSHHGSIPVAFRLGNMKEMAYVPLMGNVCRRPVRYGAIIETLTESPIFLRNVPASFEAFLPVESAPRTVKLLPGEPGQFDVTLRNPFRRPVELSAAGQRVALPAGGEKTLTIPISADRAAAWQPLVWQSPDDALAISTPVNVVLLTGQRAPILRYPQETNRLVEMPDSSAGNGTDEVTVAFALRVNGPTGGWQTPVGKSEGINRNYLVSLHPETGELYFSGSYGKHVSGFFDTGSGVRICDGQWHQVAITYSMYDAKVCFYVDGKPIATKPNSAFYVGGKRICADSLDGGPLKTNQASVVIGGGFPPLSDLKAPPHSAVRNVRVWNRALTAEEATGTSQQ